MPKKKSSLDVDYLRTATSNTLASSIFVAHVHEEEQRLLHEKEPQQISVERLLDNPYQPRVSFNEETLQQLSETIASHGFQGILIARVHPERSGFYQITAGHRRREAAKRAGLQTLPVIVHSWSNQEMATLAATENIQREDLSPLEEGKLFQLMIDEMGLTQNEVAQAIKKDRGYVRNRLRLAKAPEDIQAFVSTKTDSMRAVIYLLDIDDPVERAPIIEGLLKKTLTTDDLPTYREELKQRKSTSAVSTPTQEIAQQTKVDAPLSKGPRPDAPAIVHEAPSLKNVDSSSEEKIASLEFISRTSPTEERVRQIKLKTILRNLKEYQKLLKKQQEVSKSELLLLHQIRTLAESLCDQ